MKTPGIKHRGQPDERHKEAHFMVDQSHTYGVHDDYPLCRYGGFHIRYTTNLKKVTCIACQAKLDKGIKR